MARIELEWHVAYSEDGKVAKVVEHLVGHDKALEYQMPASVAEAFVRARRAFFDRIASRKGAIRIFDTPTIHRPSLLDWKQ